MAFYLVQWSYTTEAWNAMRERLIPECIGFRKVAESLGANVLSPDETQGAWLTFGEYDSTAIVEFPDDKLPKPNVRAAALSITLSAGSWVKAVKTIPLLTRDDGVEALKASQGKKYPPS